MSESPVVVHLPFPWNSPVATQQSRNQTADALGVARCPVCGRPLVVRLDSKGPYFFCGCGQRRCRAAA